MDHGHHDMDSHMAWSPNGDQPMMHRHRMGMMHMSFYRGANGIILFPFWPGMRTGMYYLALIFIFALSVLVEWFSHTTLIPPGTNNAVAGVVQTLMYSVRIGLAYMVMLAVMSFNVGVLLVAVAGQGLGFFVFGSKLFRKTKCAKCSSDLPQ